MKFNNMNKKGFMMAELIVVSSIVLVTLVGLYTSYNKIFSIYKTRIGYYDVTTLYRLGFYRDVISENGKMTEVKYNSESDIVDITNYIPADEKINNAKDQVFMVYNEKKSIDSSIFNGKSVNLTFKDYVDYLSGAIDFSEFNYMMIMERCKLKDDKSKDIDDCSYAYLEIYE